MAKTTGKKTTGAQTAGRNAFSGRFVTQKQAASEAVRAINREREIRVGKALQEASQKTGLFRS